MVVTARGNKYSNVKIIDGEPILLSKFDGREHLMPIITNKKGIHSIPQHQERMECWACHVRHTSQCYGCHDNYDQTAKGSDKLTMQKSAEGYSTVATNPVFTHTVRTEVRSCEDCHLNPKALGFGTGQLNIDPEPVALHASCHHSLHIP